MKKLVIAAAACVIVLSMLFPVKKNMKAEAGNMDPANVIIVNDSNRTVLYNTRLSQDTLETYDPKTRNFQSMPSIAVTGSRIWAAMTVGGVTEPDNNNYLAIIYSDDGGITWIDPFIIVKNDENVRTYVACLWVDPDGGLWVYYCQFDTWAFKVKNPSGPASSIECTVPKRCAEYGIAKEPTALSTGKWLMVTERTSVDIMSSFVWESSDKGETWKMIGKATSKANVKRYHESQIVELKDGKLWMLSRIENGTGGGVEQSFSNDGGVTWSAMESGLPKPLIGPGSKFHITRLKSGSLLFVSHDSTSTRTDMTAYLSEDEGKNWYPLLLDSRSIVSYPDAAQGPDGKIYVIYDRNRGAKQAGKNYPSQEIRIAVFTERELKAGRFDDYQSQLLLAAKNTLWHEIRSVSFERNIKTAKGTLPAEIIEGLPKYVTATDESGNNYYLSGEWEEEDFSETADEYRIIFKTTLAKTLEDTFGLLSVNISYKTAGSGGGCGGCSTGSTAALIGTAVSLAGLIALRRKIH